MSAGHDIWMPSVEISSDCTNYTVPLNLAISWADGRSLSSQGFAIITARSRLSKMGISCQGIVDEKYYHVKTDDTLPPTLYAFLHTASFDWSMFPHTEENGVKKCIFPHGYWLQVLFCRDASIAYELPAIALTKECVGLFPGTGCEYLRDTDIAECPLSAQKHLACVCERETIYIKRPPVTNAEADLADNIKFKMRWLAERSTQPIVIFVDGCMGTGKTAFLEKLERYGIIEDEEQVIYEPVDFVDYGYFHANLAKAQYDGSSRIAALSQLFFLIERSLKFLLHLQSSKHKIFFVERHPLCCVKVFGQILLDLGHIQDNLFVMVQNMYEMLVGQPALDCLMVEFLLIIDKRQIMKINQEREKVNNRLCFSVDEDILSRVYDKYFNLTEFDFMTKATPALFFRSLTSFHDSMAWLKMLQSIFSKCQNMKLSNPSISPKVMMKIKTQPIKEPAEPTKCLLAGVEVKPREFKMEPSKMEPDLQKQLFDAIKEDAMDSDEDDDDDLLADDV